MLTRSILFALLLLIPVGSHARKARPTSRPPAPPAAIAPYVELLTKHRLRSTPLPKGYNLRLIPAGYIIRHKTSRGVREVQLSSERDYNGPHRPKAVRRLSNRGTFIEVPYRQTSKQAPDLRGDPVVGTKTVATDGTLDLSYRKRNGSRYRLTVLPGGRQYRIAWYAGKNLVHETGTRDLAADWAQALVGRGDKPNALSQFSSGLTFISRNSDWARFRANH